MTLITAPVKKLEYKPILGLSRWVQWLFIVMALLTLLSLFSSYFQARVYQNELRGMTITEEETLINSIKEGLLGLILLIALVISAVLFLIWVNRANKNIASFGKPRLNISSGWAVGWFFIPIASLYKPYQAVAEIAKASNPEIDPNLLVVDDLKTPVLIKWWWALFITSNMFSSLITQLFFQGTTTNDLLMSTYATIVSNGIDIIGITITINMVSEISRSQEIRFKKMNQVNITNA